MYRCPKCGSYVSDSDIRCDNCGKALVTDSSLEDFVVTGCFSIIFFIMFFSLPGVPIATFLRFFLYEYFSDWSFLGLSFLISIFEFIIIWIITKKIRLATAVFIILSVLIIVYITLGSLFELKSANLMWNYFWHA